MATGDTTTKTGIAATAFQYDVPNSKVPAAVESDGYRWKDGVSQGHKLKVAAGRYVYPNNTDWVVTVSGHTFVLDNTAFVALFNTPA